MLRVVRQNTYKTQMSHLSSEFFDYEDIEDEAAAALLARHIMGLVHRARKNRLLNLAHGHRPMPAHNTQGGPGAQWLNKILPGAKTSVQVFLPQDFLERVVRDIVRMVEGEANGIRGCTLRVEIWDGEKRVVIGNIVCDPKVASRYTLYVRLVRAPSPATQQSTLWFLSSNNNEAIYISPGYQLEKRRHMIV
ncbi:protein charybde [Procambarus clarkii]|uniref:protein charybde n=1 Tax=Procambarus clarkii TaxID=6728 RepID=UPI001E671B01|nr:uncharacterized protein LOC123756424 [Procambarus clarkii]